MLESLNALDTQLFYLINSHHNAFFDWFFYLFTTHLSWAVVILLFFGLVTLRCEARLWWAVVIGIALCFLLSDRISVLCFKDVVCRLRPCHALPDVHMFRVGCGGQYGFVSSHAANSFSLAMFFALRYGFRSRQALESSCSGTFNANSRPSCGWLVPVVAFLWAFTTSLSRVYLGKHYPGDILCGALVGLAIGALVYWLLQKIPATAKQG